MAATSGKHQPSLFGSTKTCCTCHSPLMKFISQLLSSHLQRYPRMQLEDIYKLLHQAAMGPEHAVQDPALARARLLEEMQQLTSSPADPLVDPISPDGRLARVHLRAYV